MLERNLLCSIRSSSLVLFPQSIHVQQLRSQRRCAPANCLLTDCAWNYVCARLSLQNVNQENNGYKETQNRADRKGVGGCLEPTIHGVVLVRQAQRHVSGCTKIHYPLNPVMSVAKRLRTLLNFLGCHATDSWRVTKGAWFRGALRRLSVALFKANDFLFWEKLHAFCRVACKHPTTGAAVPQSIEV